MRHFAKMWLLTMVLSAAMMGCRAASEGTGGTGERPAPPDDAELIQADLQREETDGIETEEVNSLVEGNNAFAFDMYHTLSTESEENLIYSPYSISQAFSMVYGGAREETGSQMADVLHYLPQDTQHQAFNALDQHLAALDENAAGGGDVMMGDEGGNAFQLSIANAVWAQEGYPFRDAYLELLARQYGAGLRVADFMEAREAAIEVINEWVADATEGRIEKLSPPLQITSDTRMVLANAIYFKGSWLFPFPEEATADGPFTLLDGSEVTVPLMHGTPRAPYWPGEDFQAVQLPYWGDSVEMLLILPAEGQWPAVEDRLSAAFLADVRERSEAYDVTLTMPRFSFDTTISLAEVLPEMGLTNPFTGEGNFSGMVEGGGLFIGDAVHKGTITVDEEGTEAAAVTGVAMVESAFPQAEMRLDRSFIFAIMERETGTILFLGRVLNPAAGSP